MFSFHYQIKGILVGGSACGKTSLLQRFCKNKYCANTSKTIGVDIGFASIVSSGLHIKVQMFDSSGDQRFDTITHAYLRDLGFVMVVYDISQHDSLQSARRWIITIQQLCKNQDVEIVLVGTKTDLVEDNKTSGQKIAALLQVRHVYVNAKIGDNVHDLFLETITRVLNKKPIFVNDNIHGVRTGPLHSTFANDNLIKLNIDAQCVKHRSSGSNRCCKF
jgi:small GTP-binding protein